MGHKFILNERILKSLTELEKSRGFGAMFARAVFRTARLSLGRTGPYADGAASVLTPLRGATTSHVVAPRCMGENKRISAEKLEPVAPLVFRDAQVTGGSSVIVTRDGAFFPQLYHTKKSRIYPTPKSAYQVMETGDLIATRKRHKMVVDKGICVFGSGANNWFHWLIEAVPRALLAQSLPAEYNDYPLLVPMSCRDRSSFEAALTPFANGRKIIRIPDSKSTLVRELIQIEPPTFAPAHVHDNAWPEPGDYRQDVEFYKDYRQKILDFHQIKSGDGPKRIFLARERTNSELHRDFNQDELLRIAKKSGFVVVQPEKLSFREQLQLYFDAEFVIGASGAAWTNTLFCRPGTRGLNWALNVYDGACVFSNFTEVSGIELFHFFVEPDQPVRNSDDAFRANYKVDPKIFARELERLLSDNYINP